MGYYDSLYLLGRKQDQHSYCIGLGLENARNANKTLRADQNKLYVESFEEHKQKTAKLWFLQQHNKLKNETGC